MKYKYYGYSGLESATISNSVTCIGGFAFEGTAWYNNQPDGIIYIAQNVYGYKGEMPDNTKIVLLEGTKSIADAAFGGCTGLGVLF